MNSLVLAIASATLIAQIQPAQKDVHFRLDDNLVHVSASVNGAPVSAVLDSGTGGVLLDLAACTSCKALRPGPLLGADQVLSSSFLSKSATWRWEAPSYQTLAASR